MVGMNVNRGVMKVSLLLLLCCLIGAAHAQSVAQVVNSLQVGKNYNTKLLVTRSRNSGLSLGWVKSLTSIFSGEPVVRPNDELSSTTPYIVVFRNSSTIEELRGICMHHGVYLKSNMNCNMPEVCRRVYSSTFKGISGFFSQSQLQKLISCFENSVDYVEKDGVVHKMEDDMHAGRFDSIQLPGEYQVSKEVERIGNNFASILRDGGAIQSGFPDPNKVHAFSGSKHQDLNVALWNLDRIDQRSLPLDKKFHYSGNSRDEDTGKGVTIYTVDSGLRRSHQEFKEWNGRGSRASHGWDFVDDDPNPDDCDGHGTHVAGTAVGRTTGVAKGAKVVGVRVLDCTGSGSVSDVVAGLDWVATHHTKPAIVTMSLGIGLGQWSRALEDAVKNLVKEYGITVVVASGNSGVDSCFVAPGNVEESITVSASDLSTKFGRTSSTDQEGLYRWANTGQCIDLHAPGVDIYSACGGPSRCTAVSDSAYAWASGTSMAVPLVAGVAATYLSQHPNASPSQVKKVILDASTSGRIASLHMKPGTPNRLLYSKVLENRPPMLSDMDARARRG